MKILTKGRRVERGRPLRVLPNTTLYVHRYQSFLWNHAASMRVQKYGIGQVVLGDLVLYTEGSSGKVVHEDNIETEVDCNDEDNCTITAEISDESVPEEKVQHVKAVSSEDLLTGSYKFEDVVLPLPGSRVLFPVNDIAETYHHLAEKDGIRLTESVHSAKEFSITSMTGSYRRGFQRPVDFEWELLTYTDGGAPLAETDLDILSKSRPENGYCHRSCLFLFYHPQETRFYFISYIGAAYLKWKTLRVWL